MLKRKKEKHIAVLAGGFSSERTISLASGDFCAASLRSRGFFVTSVDVGRDVAQVLTSLSPDVVCNLLHGPFGEDGTIQGILEYLAIPYTHSGVLASALAMDKVRAKSIARSVGVQVAESIVVDRATLSSSSPMEPPYMVKPLREGSSYGVFLVSSSDALPLSFFSRDWPYGDAVMVERYIPGKELTCLVMGDVVLPVCEIRMQEDFFGYDSKYTPGLASHVCPADIPFDVAKKIQDMSLLAHNALGCRGLSRSDFRYDPALGDVVWLEINTQPGMTENSLAPDILRASGYDVCDVLEWMLEDASCLR